MDATHASGVVRVPAELTDLCVTSCYKWMLATHGLAPCYLSTRAEQVAEATSFGWHNLEVWERDTYDCKPEVAAKPMPDLLEPGNPALIVIMFLERALDLMRDSGHRAYRRPCQGARGAYQCRPQGFGASRDFSRGATQAVWEYLLRR